jgi:hypothetical protein
MQAALELVKNHIPVLLTASSVSPEPRMLAQALMMLARQPVFILQQLVAIECRLPWSLSKITFQCC